MVVTRGDRHVGGSRTPGAEHSVRYWVMHAVNRFVVRALFRVRRDGLEHWPRAPFCLVLNHHNAWDPLVVAAIAPLHPRITWFGPRVADFSRGFKNRAMAFFGGAIPIDPQQTTLTSAVRAVRRVFASGGVLGIFAEGHGTYRESTLDPFEDGAVSFACKAGVPIVPCVIIGTTSLWFGKRLRVRFAAPISTEGVRGAAAREELSARVRAAMQAMLPTQEPSPPDRRPLRRFLTDLLLGEDEVARRIAAVGE